jgi:hypothetical protein
MHRLARSFGNAETEQVIRELRPGQIFRRKIGNTARIGSAVLSDGADGVGEKPIAHRERERIVNVVLCRDALGAAERAIHVVEKSLLNFLGGNAGSNGRRVHRV